MAMLRSVAALIEQPFQRFGNGAAALNTGQVITGLATAFHNPDPDRINDRSKNYRYVRARHGVFGPLVPKYIALFR